MEAYHIKSIPAKDTYQIRLKELRKGGTLSDCKLKGDLKSSTFHFGIFVNNSVIGVASFFQETHPDINTKGQVYRLRGMAVLETYKKKGFGSKLLNYCTNFLKVNNTIMLWCNARETAVNFYKNNGFTIHGDAFEIPKIGTHFVMYKNL